MSNKAKTDGIKGKVLVLDGRQRSTLAAVRSLGRAGIEVTVGEDRIPCLASRSKYAAGTLEYTSPATDPGLFIADVTRELERREYDMLLPMTDITMSLVVDNYDNLSNLVKIPIAGKSDYLKAIDKTEIIRVSQDLGIPVPKTHFIGSISDLYNIREDLSFPAVIKPGQSKYLTSDGWISVGVDYAFDFDELIRKMDNYKKLPSLPMIQERISGPGIGAFLLFNRGVEKAIFFHRRIREKPPSGGVSVLRESIDPDPAIKEYSIRLLKALNWHGVAMVEFKIDQRDNAPKVMEINARFWGSLQLAIDSGIDFPYMLYKITSTGDVAPAFDYKVGIKTRWLLGDLDHLLIRLFKSNSRLNLPPGSKSRIATLVDFLKFYQPGMRNEILKLSDPGPFLRELREWIHHLAR